MVDGVHHVAVAVSDVPRSVTFYQEVLEFEPIGPDGADQTAETADYYWLAAGDEEWLMLADRPDATPTAPERTDDPHVAFRADPATIGRIARRLTDRGVPRRLVETSVYFHDPDDNYVEVTDRDGPA